MANRQRELRNKHAERKVKRFRPRTKARIWYRHEHGDSAEQIAADYQISVSHAYRLIREGGDIAATYDPPRMLVIMNGSGIECKHKRPILPGEAVICLDCDSSGFDHTDQLRRPWKLPPDPEPVEEKRKKPAASQLAWVVQLPTGETIAVKAKTRPEARAIVKTKLGLRPKDGLPKGSVARRLVDQPKPKRTRKRAT